MHAQFETSRSHSSRRSVASMGNTIVSSAVLALAATIPGPSLAVTEQVLMSFPLVNTGYPTGGLLLENGSLFGTGSGYGPFGDGDGNGSGQVFELSFSNNGWVAQQIAGFTPGTQPAGGLVADANGNLYGATTHGGTYNDGTVFELSWCGRCRAWTKKVLWNFGGLGDGTLPNGGLVIDSAGNLFGTTYFGGPNAAGTVFELSPSGGSWTESVLYGFSGGLDGGNPGAGLLDISGYLYGTTAFGGENYANYDSGTVFELSPSGNVGWTERVLYSFSGGSDGANPRAPLIADSQGNLYGTTYFGGMLGYEGWGTVFKLYWSGRARRWFENRLHVFGENDGQNPEAGLQWGPGPNYNLLYGTTFTGGPPLNEGTVFQLTQSGGAWSESLLYTFCSQYNCTDGAQPLGSVILDPVGNLYGTTLVGGAPSGGPCTTFLGCGAVYKITP